MTCLVLSFIVIYIYLLEVGLTLIAATVTESGKSGFFFISSEDFSSSMQYTAAGYLPSMGLVVSAVTLHVWQNSL